MIINKNNFNNLWLILFLSLISITKVESQDYSISETVLHINKYIKPNYILKYSNTSLYTEQKMRDGNYRLNFKISLNHLGRVVIDDNRDLSVRIYCSNNSKCSTYYLPDGERGSFEYFSIYAENYDDAEKIANAVRYLKTVIENSDNEDPFASYNTKYEDNTSVAGTGELNFEKVSLGMDKTKVFEVLNVKPELYSKEVGYEIYTAISSDYDLYFFYFTNNRLTRIDGGESSPDVIISIKN